MTDIRIIIKTLDQPTQPRPEYGPSNILDKIKCYIEDVDSGMDDSLHQWTYLKTLFLKLNKKKSLSSQDKELLAIIEPCIMAHGGYDGPLSAAIEGSNLNRYQNSDRDKGNTNG